MAPSASQVRNRSQLALSWVMAPDCQKVPSISSAWQLGEPWTFGCGCCCCGCCSSSISAYSSYGVCSFRIFSQDAVNGMFHFSRSLPKLEVAMLGSDPMSRRPFLVHSEFNIFEQKICVIVDIHEYIHYHVSDVYIYIYQL